MFLRQATESLHGVEIDAVIRSSSEIRSLLLDVQWSTLTRVVTEYNDKRRQEEEGSKGAVVRIEEVQESLKDLDGKGVLSNLSAAMNEAARLAFARLVLYSGLALLNQSSTLKDLKTSGELHREDILEFCGLCQSSLRLPMVQKNLQQGTPIFPDLSVRDIEASSDDVFSLPPPQRLRHIQSILFTWLGYEPDFANAEMKRLFFTPQFRSSNQDVQLLSAVEEMISATNVAIQKASSMSTIQPTYSDIDTGGVTRVVGVNYSEHQVDPNSGRIVESSSASKTTAPKLETMEGQQQKLKRSHNQNQEAEQERQRQKNHLHVATATLQQEIYQELLDMTESERNAKLAEAERATQEFLHEAACKSPGSERIEFLRSIDPSTQRLMVMHKLWKTTQQTKGV